VRTVARYVSLLPGLTSIPSFVRIGKTSDQAPHREAAQSRLCADLGRGLLCRGAASGGPCTGARLSGVLHAAEAGGRDGAGVPPRRGVRRAELRVCGEGAGGDE
jgi:hypothetical protein